MNIERDIIETLKVLKDDPDRKPLLLRGARQIGKTFIMKKFEFDFSSQNELKSVFQTSKQPERIVKELELYCNVPIIPGQTLIIFDEIQECEEALNGLKYFCDEAPQYHVMAAGSLLGIAVKRKKMTAPVGKVRILRMYPVTFKEFLKASDKRTYM